MKGGATLVSVDFSPSCSFFGSFASGAASGVDWPLLACSFASALADLDDEAEPRRELGALLKSRSENLLLGSEGSDTKLADSDWMIAGDLSASDVYKTTSFQLRSGSKVSRGSRSRGKGSN